MRMRIRELRRQKGLRQYELADAAGISRSYIAAIESEHIDKSPSTDTIIAIAEVLGVRVGDLFDDAKSAYVVGKVTQHAKVILLTPESGSGGLYRVACPSDLPNEGNIVGLEVGDDCLLPVYRPGDILFYAKDTVGVPEIALGSLCVCKDTDSNLWLKYVRYGTVPGKFHLISATLFLDNIFDTDLEWASPICLAWPRNLVKRLPGKTMPILLPDTEPRVAPLTL